MSRLEKPRKRLEAACLELFGQEYVDKIILEGCWPYVILNLPESTAHGLDNLLYGEIETTYGGLREIVKRFETLAGEK